VSEFDELELERVARAILGRVADDLATHLATIEARWEDVDAVTLPEPATTFLGHNPTVLELESSAFPFVAAIAADRVPAAEDTRPRWGYQEEEAVCYIDYFVVADDEATVNKRAWRYGEALILALRSQRSIEGFDQVDWKPEVNLSQASRHARTHSADMFDADDVDFIQMGRITVRLSGG
jgi:hypothetical protein